MNTAVGAKTAEPLALVEALAHELRQPLSAMESTAYYLAMVLPRCEKRAQEHASRLQRLIEQANWILCCAVQLADTSPLIVEPLDLEALIAETVAWQVAEGGDRPQLDLAGELPLICLDPGRARHLLKNLLAMMTRATGSEHPVRVRTSREAGVVLDLTVNTRGQGPEACFGAGASLGIESARRIVEAHGGTFQIAFGAASGARVRIVFMETTAR